MAQTRLIDVARRVGVSAKTVSNVVNGTGNVSSAVRDRVLEAVRDMGYQPNAAARTLRTGRSGLVALGIPDLREPYFAELASVFFDVAAERGLGVIVAQTKGERAAERGVIEGVGMPPLDGILFSPLSVTSGDLEARQSTTPLVLVGEHGQTIASDRSPHVGVDNESAAESAADFLMDRGRTRLAVVGAQAEESRATAHQRLEGYRTAIAGRGLELDDRLIGWVPLFGRSEGIDATREIIASGVPFDGLFCFNDSLAFGALHALGGAGLAVPDDVLVVGFDNIDETQYSRPPLASVDPSIRTMCHQVLDLIEESHTNGRHTTRTTTQSRSASHRTACRPRFSGRAASPRSSIRGGT